FVCGCRNLGEALRRIAEGAAMIRTKGEAGTGNVVEAVRHMRAVNNGIRKLHGMSYAELVHEAKELGAPVDLLAECQRLGRASVAAGRPGARREIIGGRAVHVGVAERVEARQAGGGGTRLVRLRQDLEGLDGLVIPGGESTTMTMLMDRMGLSDPIRQAVEA